MFSETKKRLQVRTGSSDKDFAKMKFSMIQNSLYSKPAPLKDGKSFACCHRTLGDRC